MKKIGVLLVLLLLLISPILAQNATNETGIKESLDPLRETAEKLDSLVEKEIPIPEMLQTPARILFGIKEDSSFSLFIITMAIWIILLLLFSDIMVSFSMFSKRTSIVAGVLLTIILAATGSIGSMGVFLMNTASNFKFLESWSVGALFFWIILILAIWFILHKIMKRAKEYQLLEEAREEGIEAGADLAVVKWMRKMFTSVGKAAEKES